MGSTTSFPATKNGLLKMQDPVTKNWRWRYCVLQEGYMIFFAEKNDFLHFQSGSPISQKSLQLADGYLFLLGATVETLTRRVPLLAQASFCSFDDVDSEDGDCVFRVRVASNMHIYFATNSIKSCEHWCDTMRDQIQALPDPLNLHKEERIQPQIREHEPDLGLLEDIDRVYQKQLKLARDFPPSKEQASQQDFKNEPPENLSRDLHWMGTQAQSPSVSNKQHADVYKRWRELVELVTVMLKHPSHPLEVKDRSGYFWSTHQNCFVGSEFVDWLADYQNLRRAEAVEIAYEMYEFQIFHHVEYSEPFEDAYIFYRFQCHETDKALNMNNIHPVTTCIRPANVIGQSLAVKLQSLYYKYTRDGGIVDYEAIGADPEFAEYLQSTTELQATDPTLLNPAQKIVFWINIYNCMVIHEYSVNATACIDKRKFFSETKYNIGRNDYCLDDIEHGVLRCNLKGPKRIYRQFSNTDPRRLAMLNARDPRIHFVLALHTNSSPPLLFLTERNFETCLAAATTNYIQSTCSISYTCDKATIHLPMILKWYLTDFAKSKEDLLKWVSGYCSQTMMNELLVFAKIKKYEIRYEKYEWKIKSCSSQDYISTSSDNTGQEFDYSVHTSCSTKIIDALCGSETKSGSFEFSEIEVATHEHDGVTETESETTSDLEVLLLK